MLFILWLFVVSVLLFVFCCYYDVFWGWVVCARFCAWLLLMCLFVFVCSLYRCVGACGQLCFCCVLCVFFCCFMLFWCLNCFWFFVFRDYLFVLCFSRWWTWPPSRGLPFEIPGGGNNVYFYFSFDAGGGLCSCAKRRRQSLCVEEETKSLGCSGALLSLFCSSHA